MTHCYTIAQSRVLYVLMGAARALTSSEIEAKCCDSDRRAGWSRSPLSTLAEHKLVRPVDGLSRRWMVTANGMRFFRLNDGRVEP